MRYQGLADRIQPLRIRICLGRDERAPRQQWAAAVTGCFAGACGLRLGLAHRLLGVDSFAALNFRDRGHGRSGNRASSRRREERLERRRRIGIDSAAGLSRTPRRPGAPECAG